jgi:hypothetical protein
MRFNLPYKLRAFIYIATGILTPIVVYLLAKDIIDTLEMTLWAAEVTFVMGLAGLNTSPTDAELERQKSFDNLNTL